MIDLEKLKQESNPMKSMKKIRDCYIAVCNYLFISYPQEMAILFDGKDDAIPTIKKAVTFMRSGILEKENDKTRYILSVIFILNSIESIYGNLLWKSYFRGIHDNSWRLKFSKSSYYRIKYKAAVIFINMLLENY